MHKVYDTIKIEESDIMDINEINRMLNNYLNKVEDLWRSL